MGMVLLVVCVFPPQVIVISIKSFTVWSNWLSDLISGRGYIAVCVISRNFSQSTGSYALRGFGSDLSSGWMFHSEYVPLLSDS